ncbi:TRAP transporter small permease subunit [Rhodalgimonas zhirmunskyi]|uniref:TRAP transporter small permease protein n=1 Tax=Rhodalgimonas zhirmunskyi TaxID=2964767 RepID=A0AAJ1X704_9RHOB|nr:TRAP transporter small permease subunit [Rhodoalgimonas zhirmunskyi]MDQ2094027.1 TRAP transporter small permease subunit [Rhodoalgimonas zhirmunskyi]
MGLRPHSLFGTLLKTSSSEQAWSPRGVRRVQAGQWRCPQSGCRGKGPMSEMTMSDDFGATGVTRGGAPAPLVRLFGWTMLAALAAFLINNVLVVSYDLPGVRGLWSGQAGAAWPNLAVLAVAVLLAWGIVLRNSARTTLRADAHRIHRFNCYLIRAAFWAVLLVGVGDFLIALARVENLFFFLGEDQIRNLAKPIWVGTYIHMPLVVVAFVIALFTRTLGFHWLALLIVTAELGIVISRFGFSYEQALMGDLVRYWYAALFLFAAAFTLYEDGHVRVDVLYAGFGPTTKGMVNAFGSIILGMATAWVILYIGLNGKQSIINSPVLNFEVTQSGQTGMYVKYQMAAFLGVFASTMLIQFVSFFFEAWADWRGEPGKREIAPAAH